MNKVFYAGCFDPFTNGHLDVIRQALERFDFVCVGLGINAAKTRYFDRDEMIAAVTEVLDNEGLRDRVQCLAYDNFTGETALELGCACLIRGIKNMGEFDYELWLANYNRAHYQLNTLFFLPSRPDLEIVSSTYARELLDAGDLNTLKSIVPAPVFDILK